MENPSSQPQSDSAVAPPEVMFIRIRATRRRTFHTHGFPYPHGGGDGMGVVPVKTWCRSRPVLARAYRDMRAFGLSAEVARGIAADMLLVPR